MTPLRPDALPLTGWGLAIGAVVLGVIAAGLLSLGWWRRRPAPRNRARRLEQIIRQRTARLERALAERNAFAATLCHEIRNPLNGLIGAVRALESGPLDRAQREQASVAHACASHLSALAEGMLDLTEAEAGARAPKQEDYEPEAVLREVGLILAEPARQAGVTLATTIDRTLPHQVRGDPGHVRQIVVNFTTNAIKFAPAGPVDLAATVSTGWLMFSVADRGQGIPAADQRRLFTPFSRLASARQAGLPGRGLGLAISRQLAEQMGGTVGVRSREGGGAVFWLRLPLQTASPVSAATGAQPPAELVDTSALIVEDDDYNASALEFVLHNLGITSVRARSGHEALVLLRSHACVWVFVDRDLPDLRGPDFVRAAKAAPAIALAPLFIATTASDSPAVQRECRDAGMDGFVAKPINPERLRAALLAVAKPRRAGSSVQQPPESELPSDLLEYLGGGTEAGRRRARERLTTAIAETVNRLDHAAHTGDRQDLRRAAHHLVAQARIAGAEPVATLAAGLEERADTLPAAELSAHAAAVSRAASALLRDHLTPTPAGPE